MESSGCIDLMSLRQLGSGSRAFLIVSLPKACWPPHKIDRFAILPEPAVNRHKDVARLLPPAAFSLKSSARNARAKLEHLRSLRTRSFDRSLEFAFCLIFSVLTGRQ
jgi:hypothetical protein